MTSDRITRTPLERFTVVFQVPLDKRDTRISQLEDALRQVRKLAEVNDNRTDWARLQNAGHVARMALFTAPECDAPAPAEYSF